jgi:hypothetical protein
MDPELRRLIDGVTGLRPRRVLDHILKHGYITTAELRDDYGYDHPPRAARDVREQGIPLVTDSVTGPNGRKIAAYRLGDAKDVEEGKSGRRALSKSFKEELVAHQGELCGLCGWHFPERALQIDHRVPYEVAGDDAPWPISMPTCSCAAPAIAPNPGAASTARTGPRQRTSEPVGAAFGARPRTTSTWRWSSGGT